MELVQAYINTDYIISDINFPDFTINIDNLHSDLDTHIEPMSTWAFITAYNPFSQELSLEENAIRNTRLLKDIIDLGLTSYKGFGRSKNLDFPWEESSLFVLGISRDQAKHLGRTYEQNAIVFGNQGTKAELLVLV